MNNPCPCKSGHTYKQCCSSLHLGNEIAQSVEQLMRSRYCAFTKNDNEYVYITHSPTSRENISLDAITQWNKQCEWLGLDIRHVDKHSHVVEFVAWYKQDGKLSFHHEVSQFKQQKIDTALMHRLTDIDEPSAWYYLDATYPENVIKMPQRNDNCICGSKKKYKKCCG